ncbi:MAG: AAA family ATPase [Bacteroidetes bacterium]|nr:AAA family ATPase [Bacteroidota bacterium]
MNDLLFDANITSESDVEQKFIYKLLTSDHPTGLGIPEQHIKTQTDIRRINIDKGSKRKLYYSDYLITVRGIPVLLIEAKSPDAKVEKGFREARLYAAEVNAQFPTDRNPLRKIIATNFEETWFGKWDNETPIEVVKRSSLHVNSARFNAFIRECNYRELLDSADSFLQIRQNKKYWKPKRLLGGSSVQGKEIGYNYFGGQLSLEYRHLFNPKSKEERAHIVSNAYIQSESRSRYIDSIDRVIRAATPPSFNDPRTIQTTEDPEELIDTLRQPKELTGELILLIGHVGSGKSTFVDYLREVALPKDIKSSTLWADVDLNDAPINSNDIYPWVCNKLSDQLTATAQTDFESLENLKTLFHPELSKLKRGELAVLGTEHPDYKREVYNTLKELREDPKQRLNALFRHLGAERQRTPVVVLDNADRGVRDEQLLMFQVAKWIQSEFKCIVFLPIREQTYDSHKDDPPLDTAIKDLLFRIEAPSFQSVLSRRIDLAIDEMESDNPNEELSYDTSQGYTIKYKRKDQGSYLKALKHSLFNYDNFLRNMIVGLAGRNIRRAMEIFLEFCRSGHISDDDIFQIRATNGEYKLSKQTLSNVVFRIDKRYYGDNNGYVKNLFKLNKTDDNPSHFIRYAILQWLKLREDKQGPSGAEGFHKVRNLNLDLEHLGFDGQSVQRELHELVESNCVVTEHLRTDIINKDDLIHIGPAGDVHLGICKNIQYLSAIAEDTFLDDRRLAESISKRIADASTHYNERSEIRNAYGFVRYLSNSADELHARLESVLRETKLDRLYDLSQPRSVAYGRYKELTTIDPWAYVNAEMSAGDQVAGVVDGKHRKHGLFITIHQSENGEKATGLLHSSKLSPNFMDEWQEGDEIEVTIKRLKANQGKATLSKI